MNYLFVVTCSFITSWLCWAGLVYLQMGNVTETSKWAYDLYQLKEDRARSIDAQKVVIVAGSNGLFGFNSKRLQEEWHTPVINFGVHAGLGLDYILYRSKKIVKPGDLVILPLEYAFYQNDAAQPEGLVDFTLARDTDYFSGLPLLDKISAIQQVSFSRLRAGFRSGPDTYLKSAKAVYHVRNVNLFGDQINTSPDKMTKKELSALSSLTAKKIERPELSRHFQTEMKKYLNWAREKNICVIAVPANMMHFSEYDGQNFFEYTQNIEKFYQSQSIEFLGKPSNYMYSREFYFNTEYHLNSVGAARRTAQTIEDLGSDPFQHCHPRHHTAKLG